MNRTISEALADGARRRRESYHSRARGGSTLVTAAKPRGGAGGGTAVVVTAVTDTPGAESLKVKAVKYDVDLLQWQFSDSEIDVIPWPKASYTTFLREKTQATDTKDGSPLSALDVVHEMQTVSGQLVLKFVVTPYVGPNLAPGTQIAPGCLVPGA